MRDGIANALRERQARSSNPYVTRKTLNRKERACATLACIGYDRGREKIFLNY